MSGLPSGAVTFLFSDIEGSTRLVKALRERYPRVLAEHRRLVRAAIAGQGGHEVDTQGDAFFVAFAGAKQAVLCALEIQRALAGHEWPAGAPVRVRIGIHTGNAVPLRGGYTGLAVHRAARICAAARGGQVLVSQATQTIIEDEEEEPGFTLVDVGERTLKDLDRPVRLFQLAAPGLDTTAAPAGQRAGGPALGMVASPPGAFAAATRALPRDIAAFTGRQAELAQLMGALAEAAADGEVAGLCAIGGMAGVGKTALAVHAAHQLAGDFPDGQFFLPLHAHTAGQQPVDPADALASLLLTAGLAAPQIPPGLEARTARWRDAVAGKKILLVLDDAVGHEQVRPLLPGTAGSLVLITSRRRLTALEDAAVISLDTLSASEAAELLARLAGRAELASGAGPARELTRLCGYLPLAIGMLARQLRHHPARTVAGMAAELAAARDRLAMMHAENLSVAAAFDLSYADLTEDLQRLFRRAGLVPGPGLDAYAVAALEDTSLATARRGVDELYDHHLLTEPASGRYQLHNLLREHARALAVGDSPTESDAAVGRLLDYYLHTAVAAGRHFAPRASAYRRPLPGHPPAQAPDLSALVQAAAWLEAERANLHAAADYAADRGRYRYAIVITAAISGFLAARGHWDQSTALHQTALAAARRAGDRLGEADTLGTLGELQQGTGDHPAAAASQQQALALFGDLGHQLGQAYALNDLGLVQQHTGDYPAAAASHQQALALFTDLGNLLGQAEALNRLGELSLRTSATGPARDQHTRALAIARDIGAAPEEARALEGIGNTHLREGNPGQAAAHLCQALTIYQHLGAPAAQRVQEVLQNHRLASTIPQPQAAVSDSESDPPAPARHTHEASRTRRSGTRARPSQEYQEQPDLHDASGQVRNTCEGA